ncbi:protein DpdD [Streptomyces sp. NRRL_ISP-5395]|uniref:protein DpdD n=1 Tax=Streptomyces TaxID=1883 RepID=UPI0018751091|nr:MULTISPECIES: protein DpdD [Streptomyces]MDX2671970.1 protein DpdD [Streptomyces sp. NRRL_ISP-5395]
MDHFLHPDRNAAGKYPKGITLLRNAAVSHRRAPMVLPWLNEQTQRMAYYVIPRRREQLTSVRDLLVAFVGPSLAKYGYDVPVALDRPHEASIHERYGAGSTFVVQTTADIEERKRLRSALERMVTVVERSPERAWSAPKPLGRLLADFEAALVSGAPQTAKTLLQQIDRQGGLSPTNVKHLEIRLLTAQGRANGVLSLPGLREVLLQDPPVPVKDMVLSALFTAHIEPALAAGELACAVDALKAPNSHFSLLADGDLLSFSEQAVTVLLVGMYGRGDGEELSRSIALLDTEGRGDLIPDALVSYRRQAVPAGAVEAEPAEPDIATTAEPEPDGVSTKTSLNSWAEIVKAVAQGDKTAFELCRRMDVRRGDTPVQLDAVSDGEIADVFAGLTDTEYEVVWQYALGPFLQELTRSDLTLRQTLTTIMRSIVNQRCDPANLAVLDLLLELFLRSAPKAAEYEEFLEQLSVRFDEWVAPETAGQALDFVDRLVAWAAPAPAARVQTAQLLFGPLHVHMRRLEEAYLSTARSLSNELGLGMEWPEQAPSENDETKPVVGAAQILVYGLDEGVLQRVQDRITRQFPLVKVVLSTEKVASKHLKETARNSDFSVVITQCAAHAATNCIGQYAKEIVYPRGAGSVSVTHAAITTLYEHAAKQQELPPQLR